MRSRLIVHALLACALAGCGQTDPAAPAAVPALRTKADNVRVDLRPGWNGLGFQATELTDLTASSDVAGAAFFNGREYETTNLSATEVNSRAGGRRGLWVFARSATNITYSGTGTAGFIDLQPGYNLVSFATTTEIRGSELTVTRDGQTVPLASVVLPVFIEIQPDSSYASVNIPGGTIKPGRAYWVFASAAVRIHLPGLPSPSPSPSPSPTASVTTSPSPGPTPGPSASPTPGPALTFTGTVTTTVNATGGTSRGNTTDFNVTVQLTGTAQSTAVQLALVNASTGATLVGGTTANTTAGNVSFNGLRILADILDYVGVGTAQLHATATGVTPALQGPFLISPDAEFRPNTTSAGSQILQGLNGGKVDRWPGGFVATWIDQSVGAVKFQRFDGNGVAQGGEVTVFTDGDQTDQGITAAFTTHPNVAVDALGRIIVAWEGGFPGRIRGLFARRYNSDGTLFDSGPAVLVNAYSPDVNNESGGCAVDAADNGNFAVSWVRESSADIFSIVECRAGNFANTTTPFSAGPVLVEATGLDMGTTDVAVSPDGTRIGVLYEALATNQPKLRAANWGATPVFAGGDQEYLSATAAPAFAGMSLAADNTKFVAVFRGGDDIRLVGRGLATPGTSSIIAEAPVVGASSSDVFDQPDVGIAKIANGSIAVVARDVTTERIVLRVLDSLGVPLAPDAQAQLNAAVASRPAVSRGADGRFVVMWESATGDVGATAGPRCRLFKADGTPGVQ